MERLEMEKKKAIKKKKKALEAKESEIAEVTRGSRIEGCMCHIW